MTKKFELDLNQELVDYVQRLGYEVDGYAYIINNLFEMHKDDVDDSLIQSVPFQTYNKQFFEAKSKYEMAKVELEREIKKLVVEKTGIENPKFSWDIPNFSELKAFITVTE